MVFRDTISPSSAEKTAASFESQSDFPLSSDWQSPSEKKLAKRAFNLCIGYAVPASTLGWKNDHFSLESMMKTHGSNFFGIKVEEEVRGIIPEDAETELALQLHLLQEILPGLPVLEYYNAGMEDIKKADWYTQAIEKLDRHGGRKLLSLGGEEDGLMLLLQLSKLCLVIAKGSGEGDTAPATHRKRGMIKPALSIILPIVSIQLYL